jgi:hypothetical protein
MSKKLFTTLWIITGLAMMTMLVATIGLAVQSNTQGGTGEQTVSAYLASDYPMVILLNEPDPRSNVASIQKNGTAITVTESSHRSGETWYHVIISDDENGWVQGEYISLDAPQ